jgi:hypothetical protein
MSSWRQRFLLSFLPAAGILLSLSSAASACPFCDGGAEGFNPVRQTIFGADFWQNLLVLATPLAVFLATAAAIYHNPRDGGR